MIKTNILFANLVQETKELNFPISWKKNSSQKDKLLYADAELANNFRLFADISYREDIPFYGFGLCGPSKIIQVMPNEWEPSELFFDMGFFSSQKAGLQQIQSTFILLGDLSG